MASRSSQKLQLIAEFLSNIGVAWFASGVISIFLGNIKNPKDILFSLFWGLLFSGLFLSAGVIVIEEGNKK